MKDQKRVTVWVDRKVKKEAEAILRQLGLSPTSIVNLMYKKVIELKKVPFEIKIESKKEFIDNSSLIRRFKDKIVSVEDGFENILEEIEDVLKEKSK